MSAARARWWSIGILTGAYAVAAAAMFGWAMPGVRAACGVPPLDGRFSWSRTDAQAFVAACGTDGLRAYATMELLDLVYPALLAAALLVWTMLLSRDLPGRWRIALAAPALAGMLADYLENAAAWSILAAGRVPTSPLIEAGGGAALVKNVAGGIAFAVVGVLAVRRILAAVRTRIRADR